MLPTFLGGHFSLTTVSSSRIHAQVSTTVNHWTLGKFVRNDLIPLERNLSDAVPECVIDDDKSLFLNFMRRTLCWLPEGRATAKELKEDPWLDFAPKRWFSSCLIHQNSSLYNLYSRCNSEQYKAGWRTLPECPFHLVKVSFNMRCGAYISMVDWARGLGDLDDRQIRPWEILFNNSTNICIIQTTQKYRNIKFYHAGCWANTKSIDGSQPRFNWCRRG